MKTLGYIDKADGNKRIHMFFKKENRCLFQQKRIDRINEAFKELRSLGNCLIVLVDGNKTRVLINK